MTKKVESLRVVSGNNNCVRLLSGTLLDAKWVATNFDWNTKKRFLVVKYALSNDKYLPTYDLNTNIYWDSATYNELNVLAPTPSDLTLRSPRKPEKIEAVREIFKGLTITRFWSDDFIASQDKYIEWANTHCGKTVTPLSIGGKSNGDD